MKQKGGQDGKVVLLTSKIEENEHAIRESNERASSFERECKELKEKVALLQEEVDVLELVCEKMYSSGGCGGMDELEGLEIDGAANCFRSQLESLTNMDERDDDNDDDDSSIDSTDAEWDRLEEENKLLRAENELLQESMDCLRKELDEARSDAMGLTQELKQEKSHNIRAVSSMNDLTIEMTVDGSSECAKRRDSIPLFVEGEDIMVSPLDTTPFSGTETEGEGTEEAEKTIRLLLKCAYSARRVSEGNDNLNLNQDLLQLISNLRKLDDDRTDEMWRTNSPPRKRDSKRTRRKGDRGRGRSRQRTNHKERSKMLTKSRLRRIREKSA